jgi:hypothetical protein
VVPSKPVPTLPRYTSRPSGAWVPTRRPRPWVQPTTDGLRGPLQRHLRPVARAAARPVRRAESLRDDSLEAGEFGCLQHMSTVDVDEVGGHPHGITGELQVGEQVAPLLIRQLERGDAVEVQHVEDEVDDGDGAEQSRRWGGDVNCQLHLVPGLLARRSCFSPPRPDFTDRSGGERPQLVQGPIGAGDSALFANSDTPMAAGSTGSTSSWIGASASAAIRLAALTIRAAHSVVLPTDQGSVCRRCDPDEVDVVGDLRSCSTLSRTERGLPRPRQINSCTLMPRVTRRSARARTRRCAGGSVAIGRRVVQLGERGSRRRL